MAISTTKSVAEETSSCTAAVASLSTAIQVRRIGFTIGETHRDQEGSFRSCGAQASPPFRKERERVGHPAGLFSGRPSGAGFFTWRHLGASGPFLASYCACYARGR